MNTRHLMQSRYLKRLWICNFRSAQCGHGFGASNLLTSRCIRLKRIAKAGSQHLYKTDGQSNTAGHYLLLQDIIDMRYPDVYLRAKMNLKFDGPILNGKSQSSNLSLQEFTRWSHGLRPCKNQSIFTHYWEAIRRIP